MKLRVLMGLFTMLLVPAANAYCPENERVRVYEMMQEAASPADVFFTELCARNYSGVCGAMQWEVDEEEFGRSTYDRTEEYSETRSVELYNILHSGESVENKVQAYRELLLAHPEMAEEFMENLLMQYYLVGKNTSAHDLLLSHTREQYLQMAEQLFRTPGLNWGLRGKSYLTPAGILFRFLMGTAEVEPIAQLFCRYALFDETDCLHDHPPVALAAMADCPSALRLLLARGNTSPELAAYCIRRLRDSHSQAFSPQDVAKKYCGYFYLSHDIMYSERLLLGCAQELCRPKQHGAELLDMLLPLLSETVFQAAPAEAQPCTYDVSPSYPALQQRCPSLLPPLVPSPVEADSEPKTENEPEPSVEDEEDIADEEDYEEAEATITAPPPSYTEAELRRAAARMEALLSATAVDSVRIPVLDETHEITAQLREEMQEVAFILCFETLRNRRIPPCVEEFPLVQRLLEDEFWESTAEEESADILANAESFAQNDAVSVLVGEMYQKWERLLKSHAREVDIAVPLHLQNNEQEIQITVSASKPTEVLSVSYKREGQGGTPRDTVLRFHSYVLIGGSVSVPFEPGHSYPLVLALQQEREPDEKRYEPILVDADSEFVDHMHGSVRYVIYAEDYAAFEPCRALCRVFNADGTLSEIFEPAHPALKSIPIIIKLTE